jgi:hypothetical protein
MEKSRVRCTTQPVLPKSGNLKLFIVAQYQIGPEVAPRTLSVTSREDNRHALSTFLRVL